MKLTGWGKYPAHDVSVSVPRDMPALLECVQSGSAIARGNGRAYGDSAISICNTVHMRHFNRMIEFSQDTGQLVAEAGVLLSDVIQAFLPLGWFPAVTPGTKFVTIGGLIAADVHGKNHHKDGGFGNFVDWIDLVDCNGEIQRCSRQENSQLFNWTIGGMGLTGIILRAAFRLRTVETAWIRQRTVPAQDLESAFKSLDESESSTYSVAWIDCQSKGSQMGRSLVFLGEHAALTDLTNKMREAPLATKKKRKLTVPMDFPSLFLNRYSIKLFNSLYYFNGKRKPEETLVDWDTYFYPLDAILGWNRIYGRRGFAQFQCVIPQSNSLPALHSLLNAISSSGQGSFLAVLKKLGPQGTGISFPMQGYTLALDFPINKKSLALLTELDQIALDNGGRFYMAKDGRMTSETHRRSDNRAEEFTDLRNKLGIREHFKSEQSERLKL